MYFGLLTIGALVASGFASPADNYAVHERRNGPPHGWNKRDQVDRRATLPLRIALKQKNVERGYEFLHEVSHPKSTKYGQHWSAKEVAEMFAPGEDTVQAVRDWLIASGVATDRIETSRGLNWISFNATVDEAEELLKSEYHVYEHSSGHRHLACEEYSLPSHLKDRIDFVLPTTHFDAKVNKRQDKGLVKRKDTPAKSIGKPGSGSTPKLGKWLDRYSNSSAVLADCDEEIVPACLRALYNFTAGTSANPNNSYGIVEYTPQAYLGTDLDMFFAEFSAGQSGDRPIFDSIDGGVLQTIVESFDYNGESDLDLEYAMTLVYPQNVTLYQVGDIVEGASFNNFLDALDASYCGGDDPTQDGIYPDPYNSTGAYTGPEDCGTFSITKVISTSYGYDESDLTPAYEERQCNEYMKLGLLGVSILYSSGDYGVAGNGGYCLNADGSENNGTFGIFNPSFPASCPYVLAVGATQVIPGTNIAHALASGTQPEEASETVIYSGGGFSNVFPLPDYQKSAVQDWFSDYPPPYGADRFNNSQNTRGFPDVSANGANYVVAIDGSWALVYGTSASSPTFGSVLTLINEQRLNAGKSSIGFVNPTLYENPDVLNDVTNGTNEGCGTSGFSSAPGWDPVTGLGTPNYPKMLELFMSLP